MATREKTELLPGTLDMLILKALSAGPLHGYGVLRALTAASAGALELEEGALYPALHRLESRDFIAGEWGQSEAKRRARYYALTRAGRTHLQREVAAWKRSSEAVDRVLAARLEGRTT